MTAAAHIGIDLGTTYSLVAVLEGGVPRVLPNALGEVLTPSAVSIDGERVLVGAPALARAVTAPSETARCFKRDIGTDATYRLGKRTMRPEELSALVLQQLRLDAETALGMPIAEAVITVPAYFGEAQRRATRNAAEIAGLRVERIINEPTAAALAYGLHQRHREFRAAVLDLGGGTFDVTVLEVMEGVIEIQSSAGDARLGGEDFSAALAIWLREQIQERHGAGPALGVPSARVHEAAEGVKRRLAREASTHVALADLLLLDGRRIDVELAIDRAVAESLWANLMVRLRRPIERALRDARARASDIDEVLLVGGATRMPGVRALAADVFGRLPVADLPPDEAVALGAAVQAALKAGDVALEDLVVTDVAPFSLGIETATDGAGRRVHGLFSPILERGTVLPASRVESFHTMDDGQFTLKVSVYQGEHSLARHNQKLGEYSIDVPPGPAGTETVDVRFSYDLDGLLEVESTVRSTGKQATLVIERSPGRLSKSDIADAQRRFAALKVHPRESLPNVTALARADAAYVELTGAARRMLGEAIEHFRLVLESQDRAQIDATRARVIELTRQLTGRH